VWVLPVNGGKPQQLTNDVRDDNSPIWSPDGEWIAFRSERGLQTDLWVMPASGGPAERITDDVAREQLIDWRPGTQELAYTTGKTSQTVWAHALSDGAERQLTPDSLEASWFNVSSQGEVEVSINRGGGVFDLTSVPLAGGASRTILPNAGTVSQTYWSPDGSKLAFVSDRGGSQDIWVVDAAAGGPRQLTTWPEGELDPLWSPDGKELYFWANHDAPWGNIWRVAVSGGPPVQVTSTGRFLDLCTQTRPSLPLLATVLGEGPDAITLVRIGADGSPHTVWDKSATPCGERSPATDSVVVNVGGSEGERVAMLLPINGGAGRQLLPAGELAAEWSPDGTQLLYGFRDGNARDYGILTLADSSTRRITTTTADENGAEFSPDGSTLVFRRSVPINRITMANLTKLLAAPSR
jgi:Tol biopolymer transport system component